MRGKWYQTEEEKKEALAKRRQYMVIYMRAYNKRERSADLRGYVYDAKGRLIENYVNHRGNKKNNSRN